ncbi:MAG: NADH-quinone oxidoreductase subunit L [Bacteroidetes bacterium]|nr:NADH-quinone oxidoreductase subunit L [Bacteroidota bacterium]
MQNLALIILSPLAGFLITGLIGKRLPEKVTGWLGSLAVLVSFVLSISVFNQIAANPAGMHQKLFTFLSVGSLQIDFALQADRLTALMMLVVTGIGFLIHVYSIAYMHGDAGFYKFFAYLNLFVFNMLVLIMGANFLMLFFGWEGVGLCSYLLIGFWYENAEYGKAARKAFVMNRIGDLGLLLGLFLIIFEFGSLDYHTVFEAAARGDHNLGVITAICILLFVGAMGKSAQIPLYTWLPDAMAGPTPVSALIHAATMVTAGIYLVVRCNTLYHFAPVAQELILYVGIATSILAALIGLKQNDIKKVLAYSTVSQLGLMFVALGCGAYTAAMFHLTTHAFFKALLFLGSGSVIHGMGGEQDIRRMGALKASMPLTFWTFLIGTLAIAGFPFMSGFFSKDEILAEVFVHNKVVWALAVGSALLTSIYMLRLFFVTFLGSFRGTDEQKHHLHESPWMMTVPLAILAILSIGGGLLNLPEIVGGGMAHTLKHWLEPVTGKPAGEHAISHGTELALMGVAVAMLLGAWLYTRNKYQSKGVVPEADEAQEGTGRLLSHKFYVDEVYDAAIVQPVNTTGEILYEQADRKGIDRIVNALGNLWVWLGGLYKKVQNGNLEYYLIFMVAGLILIVGFNLFR